MADKVTPVKAKRDPRREAMWQMTVSNMLTVVADGTITGFSADCLQFCSAEIFRLSGNFF